MPRAKQPRVPRRRRDPETAQREILDAAERELERHPPDAIGLKEIARAAGVSHALVSHYFGTYAELIEAVLARRLRRLREPALARLRDPDKAIGARELLDGFFAMLDDRLYLRLLLWAVAAERPSGRASFPFREQGLRLVAEALTARVHRDRPDLPEGPLRERVELALVVAGAAAYGFSLGRDGWMATLGRSPTPAFDEAFRTALAEVLEVYVRGSRRSLP
jgi:AcrR family transcriptional regulator